MFSLGRESEVIANISVDKDMINIVKVSRKLRISLIRIGKTFKNLLSVNFDDVIALMITDMLHYNEEMSF